MATAGSGAVPCVVWEYQRDDGGYSPYSPDISAQIESAFKSGVTVFPTSEFTVNFNIMSHEWNSVPGEKSDNPLIINVRENLYFPYKV